MKRTVELTCTFDELKNIITEAISKQENIQISEIKVSKSGKVVTILGHPSSSPSPYSGSAPVHEVFDVSNNRGAYAFAGLSKWILNELKGDVIYPVKVMERDASKIYPGITEEKLLSTLRYTLRDKVVEVQPKSFMLRK